MPGSPAERRQASIDPPPPQLYRCPHCGERHQPFPMATGAADLYGRALVRDPYRPEPLGRHPHADTSSLRRDAFNPWRPGPAEEPRSPTPSVRERLADLWQGDQPDQPDQPTRPAATRPAPTPPGQPPRMTLLEVIRRLGQLPPWA